MKNSIYTLILVFASSNLLAFSNYNAGDDTTRVKTKKKTILIVEDGDEDFDFEDDSLEFVEDGIDMVLTMDLGMNGYLTPENSMSLPSSLNLMELNYQKSTALSFNFMLKGADIIKDWFYISPGIGITSNDYSFKNNIQISTGSDTTMFMEDTLITFDKNKLKVTYIQVPLVLGFRIGNPNKTRVGLQFGAIGAYKIGSKMKQKYYLPESDTKQKNKVKDDFNINPFKVDLVARINIGDIGLFGKYSVTSLFEPNKAPELYPFSVGFTFGGF